MDLCKLTEQIWQIYLLKEDNESTRQLFEDMGKEIVIIGTRSHELYESLEKFVQVYQSEGKKQRQICFDINSFWCREQKLEEKTSVVYGSVGVKESQQEEMAAESIRFTMVYHKREEKWELAHLHQSIAYQEKEEFYPKWVMAQIHEAEARAQEMELLAKKDWLTGLLNHQTFFNNSENSLKENQTFYFMVIDLDDFKKINDTYGHQAGDEVLRKIGKILQNAIRECDIAGRIGGDEFALLCVDIASEREVQMIAEGIIRQVEEEKKKTDRMFPGISIGIAKRKEGESIKEVFCRADETLYKVKRGGKNSYQIEGNKKRR